MNCTPARRHSRSITNSLPPRIDRCHIVVDVLKEIITELSIADFNNKTTLRSHAKLEVPLLRCYQFYGFSIKIAFNSITDT